MHSVKWAGAPPAVFIEHGAEQRQALLQEASAPLVFPYIVSKSIDIMAFDPLLSHEPEKGFLAGATLAVEQVRVAGAGAKRRQQQDSIAAVSRGTNTAVFVTRGLDTNPPQSIPPPETGPRAARRRRARGAV